MRAPRLPFVIGLISFALLFLVTIQLYQAYQTYDRKEQDLERRLATAVEKTTLQHEKIIDYRRYAAAFNKNLLGEYKDVLKEEFQKILPVQETVSIRDTLILEEGEEVNYLVIKGKSYDSISGISAEHEVMARDFRKMTDIFALEGSAVKSQDSSNIAFQLDQRVMSKLFDKSKYINELMVQAFSDPGVSTTSNKIVLPLLDSILKRVLKSEDITENVKYVILDEDQKAVAFEQTTDDYEMEMDTTTTAFAQLFPGNVFDEKLYLHVYLPKKKSVLLKEIWVVLLISVLLVGAVVMAFSYLFKMILNQRKLNHMKNDFISNMTHEFKTPISTISLACEAMEDSDMNVGAGESIKPYVNMISAENKRLSNLVERILQSAVIDRGELKLREEELELNDIVSGIVNHLHLKTKEVGGEMNLKMAPGLLKFNGDPVHTSNIITNLVDNALKYRKENLVINIETIKTDDAYKVVVSDNGIGIKSEYIDKIFDKLFRVPTGDIHNVKGFGLGLSYVKAIVELQGWDIKVDSKHGEGSTFTITINKPT